MPKLKKCLPYFIQCKNFINTPLDVTPKCTVTTSLNEPYRGNLFTKFQRSYKIWWFNCKHITQRSYTSKAKRCTLLLLYPEHTFLWKITLTTKEQANFEKMNMYSYLPIRDERLRQIRGGTEEDELLQLLRHVILTGWPNSKDHIPAQVIRYFHFRYEVSVQDRLIFKGERVVVP